MAADRLHDENDRRGMMALLNVIDLKLETARIRLDGCRAGDAAGGF
jgi:hypothetical protein